MVRIRLRRVGRKKQATFRVVAADKESPRDGRFIEVLGFYNPRTQPATIELKEDRIYDWISKGAQPSDSAAQIFKSVGLLDRYERFKGGEDVEKLIEEAAKAAEERAASPKTQYGAPEKSKKKPAVAEVVEEAAPEVEAEEPAAEAEAEEPVAEVEAEADADAKAETEAEEPKAEAVEAEEAPAAEEEAPEAEAEEPAAEEEAAPEAEAEEEKSEEADADAKE
ncbi:MAG: 30S ribosomal protein S16 [Chloroflexi bacterium]|nr:MAG: 30S ribosomal protein S16 [Chloroflexota bacterium]MBL1197061.1 30S ribosomal protein S16 [Chloroflexota bacterium]NOH14355.1 30S ribosomal protein S16 [Chloroflexota bacterium]